MLAVKDEAVKLWRERERDPIQLDPADLPIKSGFPPSVGHCDADHPRLPISQWFGISPVGPFEAQLQVKGRRPLRLRAVYVIYVWNSKIGKARSFIEGGEC